MQSYYLSPSRSSTVEPPDDEEYEYEIKCHQALLDDNCWPLFDVHLLPHIEANPDAHAHLLRPWTAQQHPADTKEKWHALSRQWNRWKGFRAWQLHGRRRRPGFGEYLDARRRDYFMHGGTSRRAAEPEFEQVTRLHWERDYGDYGEDEQQQHVERHAEVVKRLLPQGFVVRPPLGLLPDPKAQDLWTTYVEYLAFETECLCLLAGDARRLEKRGKGKYEVAKAKVDQQQCRVDWVLSEIEKIKEEQKAAAGEDNIGGTGSSKKRRAADDTDGIQEVVEPRLGKRRRMGDTDEDTMNTEKTGQAEEVMPARSSNSPSQARRSKRHRTSTNEPEEREAPEPRSKRRKVASMSDGPGSVLPASGVLAVSAVTATTTITTTTTSSPIFGRRPKPMAAPPRAAAAAAAPEPPGGRIKTLGPRINGKATTTTKTSTAHTSSSLCRRRPKRLTTPPKPAAAPPPEPLRERMKTLRPRINGKATTISTPSTEPKRHGVVKRPRGRLRAAAWSVS